jgi:hypothetical protein
LVASGHLRDHDLLTQPMLAVCGGALWLVGPWLDYPRTRHQKSPLLRAPVLEGRGRAETRTFAVGARVLCLAGRVGARTVCESGKASASALRVIRMPCRPSDPLRCGLVGRVGGSSDVPLCGAGQHVVTARVDDDRRGGGEECGLQAVLLDGDRTVIAPSPSLCFSSALRLSLAGLVAALPAYLHLLRLILLRPSSPCRSSFSTYTVCRSRGVLWDGDCGQLAVRSPCGPAPAPACQGGVRR